MASIKKYNGSTFVDAAIRKYNTASEIITPPTTIYSDGTAITAYTIKGNEEHTGTPTPSNPVDVNGVGVRTKNSFNINGTYTTHGSNSVSNNQINAKCAGRNESYIWFDDTIISGTYKLSLQFNDGLRNVRILCSKAFSGGTYNSYYGGWYAVLDNGEITITVSEDFKIGFNFIGNAGATGTVYNIMFSTDTNADYEPYGYKIPISSAGQTIDIYIGDLPLLKSLDGTAVDEISNDTLTRRVDSDGSVLPTPTTTQITMPSIPTTDGANTITVDTTVQPSEFTATWTGWHDATVKEWDGSQWG